MRAILAGSTTAVVIRAAAVVIGTPIEIDVDGGMGMALFCKRPSASRSAALGACLHKEQHREDEHHAHAASGRSKISQGTHVGHDRLSHRLGQAQLP